LAQKWRLGNNRLVGVGSQVGLLQLYSNLNGCDDDGDDGHDDDDDTYRMSKMSVNDHHDDYSYDT
jgi:hypothetical protein